MELGSAASWPTRRLYEYRRPILWSGRRLTKSHVSVSDSLPDPPGVVGAELPPGNRERAPTSLLLPASSSAVADGQAAQARCAVQLSQGMTREERAALNPPSPASAKICALRSKEMPKQCYTFFICFGGRDRRRPGTGFAGYERCGRHFPMLITFLDLPAYQAVGIALASDMLASAVSAYIYRKNKNLDIKNGLVMMAVVLLFTWWEAGSPAFSPTRPWAASLYL